MKKLGLVGGMSWISTIEYYRQINEGINKHLGGLNFAECVIDSINFNDFVSNNVKGDWSATYELLVNSCNNLKAAGADGIILCSNTAYIVADELEKDLDLPLINVISETVKVIQQSRVKRVAVIGTLFTMQTGIYQKALRKVNIETIIPSGQAQEYIQYTLKEELGRGLAIPETKEAYLHIIEQLINGGAEGIILGCTEIPLLLGQADVSVPVFDTTKIHADASVKFALSI